MDTILIIEDEPELVKVMRTYLEKSNYKVITATRGDSGLTTWENTHPNLVILDLNLPGMDGLDVARRIRRNSDTPIIMLTARVEETDRLIGLELGADDYITKPFSPREVVARVRAVLRRSQSEQQEERVFSVSDLEIDRDEYRLTRANQDINLTPTEFNLLAYLASRPGRVYTRLELLEAVQGGTVYEGYERSIDAHIKNLRAKLEFDPKQPRYIETVFGVGYRFRREV
ncbi:MAG: response regulator transcription factor [Anaerolineae bacterium]|nr:response regulator transcription factor [Anaerolineae bacterium]